MNLTFGTHLQLHSFSNVKFKNSTRFNILLVVRFQHLQTMVLQRDANVGTEPLEFAA